METFCLRFFKLASKASFCLNLRRLLCSDLNNFSWRSHTCGELRSCHVGQEVTLCGWITYQRCDKFVILKDSYGLTQIMFDDRDTTNKHYAFSLPVESVIQIKGVTKRRPSNNINGKLKTGEIEILAKEVKLLNASKEKLPFTSRDYEKVNEPLRQKFRYLALRQNKTQEILRERSRFLMKIREFLHHQNDFVEVETPTLFQRTPGGAKEFIVPTKFPGRCYSLVQSPQQFKQLLMVGGIDKYFQIARCYRNEGTKPDRQPEFTQLDIEVSFITPQQIRSLIEQLIKHSWPEELHSVETPFPCLSYAEAMQQYGTDKPDIRYKIMLHDITHLLSNQNIKIFDQAIADFDCIIGAIVVPYGSKHIKKAQLKEFQEKAQSYSIPNLLDIQIRSNLEWNSFLSKHVSSEVQSKVNDALKVKPNDMILIAAGTRENVNLLLGKVRNQSAELLRSSGIEIFQPNQLAFVWINDFPLFLKTEGKFESTHHPFTAPHPEDVHLVYTNPSKARSLHYDLVLNGQEIGGGSIRIHDCSFQKYILEEILQEDSSKLHHLIDALSSGCPPHGGIALGIDRIMAIMFGCQSIAEVIAFPKSLDGKDLMSGAPTPISKDDELLYHIQPQYKNEKKSEDFKAACR